MNDNGNGNDTPIEERRVSGRDLQEHGLKMLDVSGYEGVEVDNVPKEGEVSSVDWMKIFSVGKALAAFQDGVPEHVRGRWGIAARVAAHAHMWHMDPFYIADQTYVVKNRMTYMSQLIHALINKFGNLAHRLECEYIGEGQERQCKVTGTFKNGDVREYVTPMIKDIKIKNSPLWQNDPDQQHWYFAVRSWGRKWVPEVVGALYTKEEVQADPSLGVSEAPGLHARLKGSASSEEGHKAEHVAADLDEIENGESVKKDARIPAQGRAGATKAKSTQDRASKKAKRVSELPKPKAQKRQADTAKNVSQETKDRGTAISAVNYPSNVAEYLAYARRWMKAESSKVGIGERWAKERSMRNKLGMTAEDRAPLEELMQKQLER